MSLQEVAVGQVLPEQSFGPVSMTDIVRYQGASGDLIPLHHDDEFARAAGFPAAFSVGMLSAGWLASVVTDRFGETAVRRFGTRFTGIVYRGDVLTASGEVVGLTTDGESVAELELRLRNQDGHVVVEGRAEVALPPHHSTDGPGAGG
jgi:acyl dehydratase